MCITFQEPRTNNKKLRVLNHLVQLLLFCFILKKSNIFITSKDYLNLYST